MIKRRCVHQTDQVTAGGTGVDIIKILGFLSAKEREDFFHLLAEILEKVAAILEVSTRMVDTSSLNNLLALMI